MKNTRKFFAATVIFSCIAAPFFASAEKLAFSRSMAFGSRGDDVKLLQTILASDKTIYPAGLVTGYYGPLTTEAVKKFQARWSLPIVGIVGPKTLAKLQEVTVSASINVSIVDPTLPVISDVVSVPSAHSVSIAWKTSVPTSGKIWFGAPSPLDLSLNSIKAIDLSESRTAAFTGLATSTSYYFVIYAEDAKGKAATSTEYSFMTLAN